MEVRCLDVDPFHPVGIGPEAIRLLDIFLLHCLLADSPPDHPAQIAATAGNQRLVAEGGRDPLARLDRAGEAVAPADWGGELLAQFEPIAAALDEAHGCESYGEVVAAAQRALRDFSSLPSTRVLRETEREHGKSFPEFALAQSLRHRDDIAARPLGAEALARHAELAARSRQEQQRIEAADDVPFETYRWRYLEQDLLSGPHFRPIA